MHYLNIIFCFGYLKVFSFLLFVRICREKEAFGPYPVNTLGMALE